MIHSRIHVILLELSRILSIYDAHVYRLLFDLVKGCFDESLPLTPLFAHESSGLTSAQPCSEKEIEIEIPLYRRTSNVTQACPSRNYLLFLSMT